MIDDSTASEVVQEIRRGLEARGDVGRFLLGEIDRALAPGVEELVDEVTEDRKGTQRATGKKAVVQRAPDANEALLTHVHVLKSYLVDIDLAAESALRDIANYMRIDGIVVSYRSDLESSAVERQDRDVIVGAERLAGDRSEAEAELRRLTAMITGPDAEEIDATTN